jgi:hypothetical protein
MFFDVMKTITIPDELDAEAAAEAKRLSISTSELTRRGLTAPLPDRGGDAEGDPWRRLAGFASGRARLSPARSTRWCTTLGVLCDSVARG